LTDRAAHDEGSLPGGLATLLYCPVWNSHVISAQVRHRRHGRIEEGQTGSLVLAPDGRFRLELTDEDDDKVLQVWDGSSLWTVGGLGASGSQCSNAEPPFPELFNPAWLLAHFDLRFTGHAEHVGRTAYAIVGTRRVTSLSRGVDAWFGDQVDALVDAELGIILRYEVTGDGIGRELKEITTLRLEPPDVVDEAVFALPSGIDFADDDEHEASAPAPRAEAACVSVPDELVNALYEAGSAPTWFTAQVLERIDHDVIAESRRAVGDTSRSRIMRGLSRFTADHAPQSGSFSASVHVALPERYRIGMATAPSGQPREVVCDGTYRWDIYPDKICRSEPAPPPMGLALLADPSWLLYGYVLSVIGTASVGGRSGWHVVAEPTEDGSLVGGGVVARVTVRGEKIDAVIDFRLGIALRLLWLHNGQPALSTELEHVEEGVDAGAFEVTVPPGAPVTTTHNPAGARPRRRRPAR